MYCILLIGALLAQEVQVASDCERPRFEQLAENHNFSAAILRDSKLLPSDPYEAPYSLEKPKAFHGACDSLSRREQQYYAALDYRCIIG